VTKGFATLVGILALVWQAGLAQAGCTGVQSISHSSRMGCAVSGNGSSVPVAGQMMNVASAGPADPLAAEQPSRSDSPAARSNAHYICTPSGFGQIANCSLR
jgi:hypothetical protein